MGPDASLGLAGRAGGVEQDRRILGLHLRGRDRAVLAGHQIVPPMVAPLAHRCVDGKCRRSCTITCRTDGVASSATSSTDFSGAAAPRRQVPLAVITALAPPWFNRVCIGLGPNPENSGITIAPSFRIAKNAMNVSGRFGM